jgi:hypothetical protein
MVSVEQTAREVSNPNGWLPKNHGFQQPLQPVFNDLTQIKIHAGAKTTAVFKNGPSREVPGFEPERPLWRKPMTMSALRSSAVWWVLSTRFVSASVNYYIRTESGMCLKLACRSYILRDQHSRACLGSAKVQFRPCGDDNATWRLFGPR